MNRIRDECRRVARRPGVGEFDEDTPASGESPLEQAIGRQAVENYEAALQLLTEEERQAVVARIEMGFSFQELAIMLGKPTADAARMAVSRSLVRLAEHMRHGS
jgi:DNA-directed RNA polymerase specialized sigma24 family protein